jgi:putative ABC transport system permease protein
MASPRSIRYTFRSLGKSPGFTATAVLTLALGIGATAAIFSVCDAMLWKPIPLPRIESLAMLMQRDPDNPDGYATTSAADAADIRAQSVSYEALASYQEGLANIAGRGGEPERVNQTLVDPNFFDVLSVQPAIGRAFRPGEGEPGNEHEVIFSDRFWKRRFGGDRGIIGTTIRLDDMDHVVIGVMPPQFDFPLASEVWTPLALSPAARHARNTQSIENVARLKPGHTVEQAAAEVDGIGRRLAALYPDTNKKRLFRVFSTQEFLVGHENRQYTTMLFWSVVFVLLIACSNVANLQYARAMGKAREVALRTALGAPRWRLVSQVLFECVMLSLGGAVLGLAIARWGVDMIRAGMPPRIGRYILGWQDMGIDYRTLGFMLLAAVASGLLAGIAPAWQCSRPSLTENLRDGGRGSSAGRSRRRLRSVLVGFEIALAVVLLVGASLMVRGFQSLVNTANNLDPATMLSLRLTLTDTKYHEDHQVVAFYSEALRRLNALPGVKSAVAVTALPYSGHASGSGFTIEGRPFERGDQPSCQLQSVSDRYFQTLGIPLRSGRFIGAGDGPETLRTGVIGERMANKWWPHESPIGKRVKLGAPDSKQPWITIVGVAGDVTHEVYDRVPRPVLYVPLAQTPKLWMDIGVRTAGDPLRLAPAVTEAIRAVDPEMPITGMATLETWMHEQSVGLNYMAVLMGLFGILALVLSSVGVYGVMAYVVSEQTQEIGIRMALGAARGSVLRMVFRRGMITTLTGLAVGFAAAYALAPMIASLVYGVSPKDPATFIGIPLALLAAAALAIYIPARRAMRIDPIAALRYE